MLPYIEQLLVIQKEVKVAYQAYEQQWLEPEAYRNCTDKSFTGGD